LVAAAAIALRASDEDEEGIGAESSDPLEATDDWTEAVRTKTN
jgi:hypothetical protein